MRRAFLPLFLLSPALLSAAPGDEGAGKEKEKPKKEVTCAGEAGFRGWYRCGGWMPVSLVLANTTDEDYVLRVSADAEYGEGGQSGVFSTEVDLPRGARKRATLYVRPIRPFSSSSDGGQGLRVQCRSQRSGLLVCGTELGAQAVAPGRALIVVTGESALTGLKAASPRDAAAGLDAGDLPDRPEGYDGVDWVVLRGGGWASDPARAEALAQWLESGGRLAVTGAEALRALADSPLGRRLGVSLGEPRPVGDVDILEERAGEDLALPAAGGLLCERPSCRGAETLAASEEDVPLLLRAGLGAGEIRLFAVDPEVFRGQPGYWGLWRWALDLPAPAAPEEAAASYLDPPHALPWAGAVLGSALYHKEPVRLDWIWGFLAVYLLAVAPLDYLLVRRLRRWRLAGILTLAVWAVAGSALCYQLGSSGRFARIIVSRVGVLDAFPAGGRLSGRALTSVYQAGNAVHRAGPPWGKGSAAVVVDPRETARSGLLQRETLAWEEGAEGLVLAEAPVYVGTQKVFESRWRGGWETLGISLVRNGNDWRLENRGKFPLRVPGGPLIPPGEGMDLGAPQAFSRLDGDEAVMPLQAQLAAWVRNPPPGMPCRFAPGAGAQRGFSFWVEGLPLGIGELRAPMLREAVLLRVHVE